MQLIQLGNTSAMFRFTIRDVLWLTVVAALATRWYIDRQGFAALSNRVTSIEAKLAATDSDLKATAQTVKGVSRKVAIVESDAQRLKNEFRRTRR
jgi:hypothetical protein